MAFSRKNRNKKGVHSPARWSDREMDAVVHVAPQCRRRQYVAGNSVSAIIGSGRQIISNSYAIAGHGAHPGPPETLEIASRRGMPAVATGL